MILAVQNYEGAFRVYPPGTINESGPIASLPQGYHHNWMSQILPYIEESNVYSHIDFGVGVYDDKNAQVRQVKIPLFYCPSDDGDRDIGRSNYAGCHNDVEAPIDVDNHGVFFLNSAVRYSEITDGTSHTLFLGEKVLIAERDLGWMSGTRATLRNTGDPINAGVSRFRGLNAEGDESADPARQSPLFVGGFSSRHPGTVMVAFGDGHITRVSGTISSDVLRQMGNRADGELILTDDNY